MSGFTDDDLKRLKEWMKNPKMTDGSIIGMETMQKIAALLSRLEAAEKVCDMTYKNLGMYSSIEGLPREIVKSMEAWRKSKGE